MGVGNTVSPCLLPDEISPGGGEERAGAGERERESVAVGSQSVLLLALTRAAGAGGQQLAPACWQTCPEQ